MYVQYVKDSGGYAVCGCGCGIRFQTGHAIAFIGVTCGINTVGEPMVGTWKVYHPNHIPIIKNEAKTVGVFANKADQLKRELTDLCHLDKSVAHEVYKYAYESLGLRIY